MAFFSKNIDMLNGTIWDKMVVFAIPLALTGVLQQLYNLADVAVLGHFVSNEAVAAVGTNVPIVGLIVAFCIGLSIGANVVVARYLGMRKYDDASKAVHTAFATAVIFGVIAMVIGELCSSILMVWMQVPPNVVRHSEIYLQIYLLGMPFISIYNFLSAVMRSQGDTQTPLWALCIASVFNALGDLFVVTVVDWGIGGVALMTALANLLASGILVYRLMRTDGPLCLYPKRLFKMDKKALRSMIKIGWPAGLQSSVFSLSNLIIQSAINSLGADVMAASVAAFTIEINCYCVINGFGLAATTFISQNYGAGNLERCKRITRVNMALNIGITVVLSVLIYGFGRYLLGFFTQSEEIISLGMIRLLWVVIPEHLNSVMEVLSDSMRGYGYSLPPAIITVVVICTIRIVWVYSVFAAKPTYEILMMVYPLSWLVTSICLTFLYFRFMKQLPAKRCRTAVKK